MNNKEIAHQWAHQAKASGSGSHFFYDGAVIYSYGHHFPIARLFTDKRTKELCVLFTARGYSSSTARHKSLVRSAVSHLTVFEVADVMNQKTDVRSVRALAKAKMAALAKAKMAALAVAHNMEQERAVRAEKKAQRLLEKSPEIVAEWIGGKRASLPGSLNLPVMLRALEVIGSNPSEWVMETSKGARVPLTDARRTFAFLLTVRAKGWHRNGATHALGSYQLDAVNEQGVVAGCHRVTWTEIERFAKSQGWTQ